MGLKQSHLRDLIPNHRAVNRMGRFSSVQAYADNNSAIRKVPYEQAAAASSNTTTNAVVKPEKVVNPYGSTAGAGSGEFHVYRHGRNREMQRMRAMEYAERIQLANEKFQNERNADNAWAEERTLKRRRKREKQKESKRRKQNLKQNGIAIDPIVSEPTIDEEFTYIPGSAVAPLEEEETNECSHNNKNKNEKQSTSDETKPESIPNDGSFLELMSKQLATKAEEAPES